MSLKSTLERWTVTAEAAGSSPVVPESLGSGTRLTLWHNIDRRFISWGAAGWHISFDVLERLLAGKPIGRVVGAEAMKFAGWQRLNAEYAKQFGIETPNRTPQAAQKS